MNLKKNIIEVLKSCYDPEIPLDLWSLGLIYDISIAENEDFGNEVLITMSLTTPGCSMGQHMAEDIKSKVSTISGISKVKVSITFDPPWNPEMMTNEARKKLGFDPTPVPKQESKIDLELSSKIYIPEVARDIIEQISFEARESDLVDRKSGVSARMSITSLQNLVSSAERRMIINNEENTSIRMSDFSSVISSINGKVELVYEGEEEGAEQVSYNLISSAVKSIFNKYFPKIEKLTKP